MGRRNKAGNTYARYKRLAPGMGQAALAGVFMKIWEGEQDEERI